MSRAETNNIYLVATPKYNILKFISKILFGKSDTFKLENRIFIVASLVAFLACTVGVVWNSYLGLPPMLNLTVGLFIVVYFALFYYSRFKNIFNPFIFIFTTLFFLTVLYVSNGGLSGSIPALYIVALTLFISISNLKYHMIVLLITVLNLFLLIVSELFLFKRMIIQYQNVETKEMDLAFGYLASLIVCFFLLSYYKRIFCSQNKELRKLNDSKDLYFSVLAHDLRGPFNGILGLTDLMSDKTANLSKDEFQEFAQKVNDKSQETFELLESIIEWGEIHRNKINFYAQTINISQVANEIIGSLSDRYTKKEIEINMQISGDVNIFGDLVSIKTIFRNLISNAIKFTPLGGVIDVSLGEDVHNLKSVIVKDTGIGMDKEFIDNLFNPEIKTNRVGTEGEVSNGLGLIITKELVEKQGGRLDIVSTLNEGSSFIFTVSGASRT